MASTLDTTERQLARTAALALHSAIVLAYQRPDAHALLTTATRRCHAAVHAATRNAPLELTLQGDGLLVAGERVLTTGPGDGPFALLRTAGIGELVLREGIPDAAIDVLVRRLAAMRPGDDAERFVAELIGPSGLPHVLLRAILVDAGDAPASHDWWRLPDRLTASPALRAFVERDLAANLPALAAHRLLADLEQEPWPAEPVLLHLLARMFDRSDFATAAWLLAQTEHHAHLGPEVSARLHDAARARVDDGFLRQHLEAATRDEVMALAALLMQLGPSEAARLPALADAAGHPFAPLLHELLGGG